MKIIDLSHTITNGMTTYPGLPGPIICDFWTRDWSSSHYDEGTSFQIGKIEMVSNTGTYLDVPFHRYADGKDLAEISLDSLAAVNGITVDVTANNERAIDAIWFKSVQVEGKAVLVRTDFSTKWGTDDYFKNHPFLTENAAVYLRDQGARLVGIDSLNIDDTSGGARPVHSALLAADILIIEHMRNLNALPLSGFKLFSLPPKISGMGSFPVRVVAIIE